MLNLKLFQTPWESHLSAIMTVHYYIITIISLKCALYMATVPNLTLVRLFVGKHRVGKLVLAGFVLSENVAKMKR